MTFDHALDIILSLEGDYANHPADPGGKTRYGITESTAALYGLDIDTLTRDQAAMIYHRGYWQRMRCDELPDYWRLPAFDAAVQHGTRRATVMLQQAVRTKPDGIIGPKTLEAAYHAGYEAVTRFMRYRVDFYFELPHREFFQRGWMRRLVTVATLIALTDVFGSGPYHP